MNFNAEFPTLMRFCLLQFKGALFYIPRKAMHKMAEVIQVLNTTIGINYYFNFLGRLGSNGFQLK
jgi:hypothetical protein